MSPRSRFAFGVLACVAPLEHALAQSTSIPAAPAAGVEFSLTSDSEGIDVVRSLARLSWKFEGRDENQGVAIENVRFSSRDARTYEDQRIYVELAGGSAGKHPWKFRLGTDGNTILGAGSIRTADWSRELFLERDIVETSQGFDKNIYHTFVGVSADVVSGSRDVVNGVLGFQKFSGKNERVHLRGTYVRVLSPSKGVSLQLRARYFHSTSPGEYDYFSPRNYFQVLPVLQMRRFDRAGWMYLVSAGYGAQRSTGSGWERARLVDARVESPARARNFSFFAHAQYSNNSQAGASADYHFVSGRAGLTYRF